MQNILKKLICLLVVSIFFVNLNLVFADEASDDLAQKELEALKATIRAELDQQPISACRESLVAIYDYEMIGFLRFLDAHFQNKSSNSSLKNVAIARYGDLKLALNEPLQLLKPGVSTEFNADTYSAELAAYQECVKIQDEYARLAKEQMIRKIKDSTAQKQTTALVEKYKAINEKLSDLNFKIAQMYSLFVTFQNKFPFYSGTCVSVP